MSMFRARINSYLSEFINIELLIRKFEIDIGWYMNEYLVVKYLLDKVVSEPSKSHVIQ